MILLLVHFENLGCRLNANETEALAAAFKRNGFSVFDSNGSADDVCVVFVNTCTVTSKAEQKCRRVIRLCTKKFPNALILVSGCYAQLEKENIEKISSRVVTFPGMKKGLLSRFPEFYAAHLSAAEVHDKGQLLGTTKSIFNAFTTQALYKTKKPFKDTNTYTPSLKSGTQNENTQKPEYAFDLETSNFLFHSRASLKVQDGCNCACSFCRIHLARGKSVSLEAAQAVKRAQEIEAAGKNEIVLTGVNLSQYASGTVDFSQLLRLLLAGTNRVKFRISSFYPEAITERFLEAVKDERVCPYFHLSVQSGSERILALMNRPHDVGAIYAAVRNLRKIKPDAFLGADIIAGFPTETESDFEKTFALCKELAFAHIHSFPFSPRPGTPAFALKPKVPERVTNGRVARLNELSDENYKKYVQTMEGKTVSGIAETFADGKKILTENYLLLPLKYKKNAENLKGGDSVKVRIYDGFCELVCP